MNPLSIKNALTGDASTPGILRGAAISIYLPSTTSFSRKPSRIIMLFPKRFYGFHDRVGYVLSLNCLYLHL